MITIDNLILDTDVISILTELRNELNSCGINKLRDVRDCGENVMITCPSHKNGQESKPSCGVHKETGVVHCFTCGYTSTLSELIGACFDKEKVNRLPWGLYWLRRHFTGYEVEERPSLDLDVSRRILPRANYTFVPESVLAQYRYTHPYMYSRKLTDEVIEKFDIGYDHTTNCITFPVRDAEGRCLFIARRAVDRKWFHYPGGIEKSLYGVYEVSEYFPDATCVFVCESIFNALTCWTHGIPAVALNGTGTFAQYLQLEKLKARKLILALDPDEAGSKGIRKIAHNVTNKLCYELHYSDSRDLNDLSYEEFEKLIKTATLLKNT